MNGQPRKYISATKWSSLCAYIMQVRCTRTVSLSSLFSISNLASPPSLAPVLQRRGRLIIFLLCINQDDVLRPNLTIYETFWFSAQLRLPFERNSTEKKLKIQSILEELGLETVAKQRIGSIEKRGISGGQRKRVSIGKVSYKGCTCQQFSYSSFLFDLGGTGVDLITDPSVLFLDEPTSGLDSSTSYTLVETLKKLASVGRTIVTTIHQPRFFFKKNCFSLCVCLL